MDVTNIEANVYMFYGVNDFCWDLYFIARHQRAHLVHVDIYNFAIFYRCWGTFYFIHVLQVSNSQQLDFCFKVDVLLFSLFKKKGGEIWR